MRLMSPKKNKLKNKPIDRSLSSVTLKFFVPKPLIMKQLLITLIGALMIFQAHGQSDRVTSAWNNLKYNELESALENIKAASEYEDTKNDAKTWLYLGHVYFSIDTTSNAEFADLVKAPKDKAVDAYAKAMALDESGRYGTKIQNNAVRLGVALFNAGAQDYNSALKAKKQKDTAAFKKNFEKSLNHFERHFKTRELAGKYASYINQSLTQNGIDPKKTLLYAGYSAYQTEDYAKAIKYLRQLVKADSEKEDAYLFLSNVYLAKGDTTKALDVIDSGRMNVPESEGLQNRMLVIYQQSGQVNKLTANLRSSIERNPEDLEKYRVLSSTYEQLARKARDRENSTKAEAYKDSARQVRKQLLAVDPGNYKANYNLGIMHYNIGVDKVKKAQEMSDIDKVTKLEDEATDEFNEAIPYLEKAFHKDCQDQNLYKSLKNIYSRTGQPEKAKNLKKAYADANQVVINVKGNSGQRGTVEVTHSGETSKFRDVELSDREGDYIGWETNVCPQEGAVEVNLSLKEEDATVKTEIYQQGQLQKEVENSSFTYMP
jgi:cytochrome c-type biogenesis protein CcmH/NrfG